MKLFFEYAWVFVLMCVMTLALKLFGEKKVRKWIENKRDDV